jgi:hypothetical protein
MQYIQFALMGSFEILKCCKRPAQNAYPNTFYSHFGSIKIIWKDKRNSPPAYLPHIFQIYFIFDLIKRCAAQNIT